MTFASPDEARAAIVSTAVREVGRCDPLKYWRVVHFGGPASNDWSGPFALWCFVVNGIVDWTWRVGSGFLYRLPIVCDGTDESGHVVAPKPADILYLPGHRHALVVEVFDDCIRTIGGAGKGGRVSDVKACRSAARFLFPVAGLLEVHP